MTNCDKKQCSPDTICNPASGRCVKRDGLIGKRLLANTSDNKRFVSKKNKSSKTKLCPPCDARKICNPQSGRCVLRTGSIGKRILGSYSTSNVLTNANVPPDEPASYYEFKFFMDKDGVTWKSVPLPQEDGNLRYPTFVWTLYTGKPLPPNLLWPDPLDAGFYGPNRIVMTANGVKWKSTQVTSKKKGNKYNTFKWDIYTGKLTPKDTLPKPIPHTLPMPKQDAMMWLRKRLIPLYKDILTTLSDDYMLWLERKLLEYPNVIEITNYHLRSIRPGEHRTYFMFETLNGYFRDGFAGTCQCQTSWCNSKHNKYDISTPEKFLSHWTVLNVTRLSGTKMYTTKTVPSEIRKLLDDDPESLFHIPETTTFRLSDLGMIHLTNARGEVFGKGVYLMDDSLHGRRVGNEIPSIYSTCITVLGKNTDRDKTQYSAPDTTTYPCPIRHNRNVDYKNPQDYPGALITKNGSQYISKISVISGDHQWQRYNPSNNLSHIVHTTRPGKIPSGRKAPPGHAAEYPNTFAWGLDGKIWISKKTPKGRYLWKRTKNTSI